MRKEGKGSTDSPCPEHNDRNGTNDEQLDGVPSADVEALLHEVHAGEGGWKDGRQLDKPPKPLR